MKRSENRTIRCAIYTRKSTEEGLEQEFNSLDAQRESGEAYIASQMHEGWTCVPTRYDDGGYTGGNMDRPALKQLMADIEAGKIDCVVVYKVDRLSRSLLDFSRMMEKFDNAGVSFVSVTQQFNTTCSMGRLTLNILLSFAQFEREIISERTRDKIAASRRKGKWSGGMPLLGYGVDADTSKLIVDPDEAKRVRAIFDLYLEHRSLLKVVDELERKAWVTKQWTTKKGTLRGGKVFNKTNLHRLLTNITYIGKLRYKDEVHEGEHDAIVDLEIWRQVQASLNKNARSGGGDVRNRFGALLKGILRCSACNCAMVPSHSTKPGGKRYRYYVCNQAQKRGWDKCPSKSVPAGEMERFVVDQIRCIGRDPKLISEVIQRSHHEIGGQTESLVDEERMLRRNLQRWQTELSEVVRKLPVGQTDSVLLGVLADLQDRVRDGEMRLAQIRIELDSLQRLTINSTDAAQALQRFDEVWESLPPRKQCELVQLLVRLVEYDGGAGKLSISFHASGIQTLDDSLVSETTA